MNVVRVLRAIGITEGLSWLVLLFVAMPLKYIFGDPRAVRVVGMAHGALFTVFVLALVWAHTERGWRTLQSAKLFGASLLPFGFLLVDRSLKAEAELVAAAARAD